MIIGAHSIIYSKNPDADRAFLRDVLELTEMKTRKVACGPVHNQGWGMLTQVTLPGGGKLGVYQPRHARPQAMKGK
jgi:hypothetical protein